MRALVTGGGGFLGRYLVERLVARGERVRVLCRGDYPPLAALGAETVRGDIRDRDTVFSACRGCDVVYHSAAVSGIWGSWTWYHGINTIGTENVIAACQSAGVARLIYTSSPSVIYDGREHLGADERLPYPSQYLCHYPQTKALAERAVLAAHGRTLATIALRPHLIWGPRDNHLIPRLIDRARRGRLRQVGGGTNLVSVSYVENTAAAHLQAADRLGVDPAIGGRPYFINEPEPVRLWDWINALLGRAGLPPVSRRVSARLAYAAGSILEATSTMLGSEREPLMTRFLAQQLSSSHWYRIDAARAAFGYQPIVSVEEGLSRLEPELKRLAQQPLARATR